MSIEKGNPNKALFWGCFIALITTAFGFITRMFLLDDVAITEGLLKLDQGHSDLAIRDQHHLVQPHH
jgi:hypothetical protein